MADDNVEACTFGIPYFNKVYMKIRQSEGLAPIYSSIHEYAHAIAFTMNHFNLMSNKKLFLEESYSLFF